MSSPSGSFGGINPDGTPNYGAGPVPVQGSDPTNIWYADLPTSLQNTPGAAPLRLWYDTNPATKGHQLAPGSYGPMVGPDSASNQQGPAWDAKPASQNHAAPADILKQVAALQANDPAKLANIQELMSSGVWGTVNVNGVFDDHTEKALINAMERYYKITHGTGAGMSFMDYLQSSGTRALQLQQQQKAAGTAPQQVRLADPAAIASAAQSAAQSALGKGLSKDQLDQFVLQFQAEQRAYETSNSPTVNAPQLGTDAMSFVQSTNPSAYQGHNRTQYLDALVNMMGGSRPNATEPVASVATTPNGGQ